MKRAVSIIIMGLLFVLLSQSPVRADELGMFNYQGYVRVQGKAFHGKGWFKFALITHGGSVTHWSNDGSSVDGEEPVEAVECDVSQGVFSIMLGDPQAGMQPINSVIFNQSTNIWLRIWFSDGQRGFQQLKPDQKIANQQLISIPSGDRDFTIHVNGRTGDDRFSGLHPSRPKRTIQAAVNMLPERVRCNVTIAIAEGTYYEKVEVAGVICHPGKQVIFKGDESWTPTSLVAPNVRISGYDSETSPVSVRTPVFFSRNSTGVLLQGIEIANSKSYGLIIDNSNCRMENCRIAANEGTGILIHNRSSATLLSCVSEENAGDSGITIYTNSSATISNCILQKNRMIGIVCAHNSQSTITNTKIISNENFGMSLRVMSFANFFGNCDISNNKQGGILAVQQSCLIFGNGYAGTIRNNLGYGIFVRYESMCEDADRNTFSGNTQGNTYADTGGAFWQ
jgi:hypothetical protein